MRMLTYCVFPRKSAPPRCEMRTFESYQQFQTVEVWRHEGQTVALCCALGRPSVKSWGHVTCGTPLLALGSHLLKEHFLTSRGPALYVAWFGKLIAKASSWVYSPNPRRWSGGAWAQTFPPFCAM